MVPADYKPQIDNKPFILSPRNGACKNKGVIDMAVKKRCPHCLKVMENIGTAGKSQWVCNNTKKHKYPVYVPPLTDVDSAEDKA